MFWAEAVLTAVTLRNRSPTKAVEENTPYICFMGIKPNVSSFRVFGCTAYMNISKEIRTKCDAKSTKCIVVGYCINSKRYRLWNQERRRIRVSRDVVFLEYDFNNHVDQLKELSEPAVIQPHFDETESENDEQLQNERERHSNVDYDEVRPAQNEIRVADRAFPRQSERVRRPP